MRRTATVAAASQSVSHCACVREPCGKGGCTILGSVLRLYGPEVPPAADQQRTSDTRRRDQLLEPHSTSRHGLNFLFFVLFFKERQTDTYRLTYIHIAGLHRVLTTTNNEKKDKMTAEKEKKR